MLNSHIGIKEQLKISIVLIILLLLCLSAVAIYEAIKYGDNVKENFIYYRIDDKRLIEINENKISFYYCIKKITIEEFDSLKIMTEK